MRLSDRLLRSPAVALCCAALISCQPAPEERLARAEALAARGDYDTAAIELKNVLRSEPGNVTARRLLAKSAYQIADFRTAEIENERLLGALGDDLEAWVGLGNALLRQGRGEDVFANVYPHIESAASDESAQVLAGDTMAVLGNHEAAAQHYRAALALNPASDPALCGLVGVAISLRDGDNAARMLAEALARNPDSPAPWRLKAMAEQMGGNYALAAQSLGEAIARETAQTPYADQFITRLNRAVLLIESENLDAAREQISDLETNYVAHPLLHFLRGRLALAEGNYDVAQTELREYLARAPDDMRGQMMMGVVNFSQNYLRQAEMYLRRAVRENVGGDTARRLLAETQLRLNNPDAAIQSLGTTDGSLIDDPALLNLLGRAQLGIGNVEQGLTYLERSLAMDPDNTDSRISLAAGRIAAEDYEGALAILRALPPYEFENFGREILLMGVLLKLGDVSEAEREAGQIVLDHPEDAGAHVVSGQLQYALGNNESARTSYRRALVLDSKSLPALYGLGRLALESGDTGAAWEWFERSIDVQSQYGPSLSALAQLATELGRYEEIEPRLQAATRDGPDVTSLWVLRARTALINGEIGEAADVVAEGRRLHPLEPLLMHAEGLVLTANGKTDEGIRRLAEAAELLPRDGRVHYDLAAARCDARDYRGCLAAIGRYRALDPDGLGGLRIETTALVRAGDVARARVQLADYEQRNGLTPAYRLLAGDIELLAGNPEAALERYRAVAETGMSRDVVVRLIDVYRRIDVDEALATAAGWLAAHPDDERVRRTYAQVLEQAGNAAAATSEYEALIAAGSDDPVALNNLAWQYLQEGKPGAAELAEKAARLAPDNGSVHDTLGWILYHDGRLDEALSTLRRAAELSPQNPEIRYHLAQVLTDLGRTAEARAIVRTLLDDQDSFPSRDKAMVLADTLE